MTDLVIILVYLAMMLIWIFKKIKFGSLVFSTTIRIIIIKFIYSLILPLGASSIGALGGLFWLLDRERRIVIIKSVDHETLKEIQGSLQQRERRTKEVLVGCIFFMFLGFLIYLLPH